MKKPLYLGAIALVIAGLMISSAASIPLKHVSSAPLKNTEKSYEAVKAEKQLYYNSVKAVATAATPNLKAQVVTVKSEQATNVKATPAPLNMGGDKATGDKQLHNSIADGDAGQLVISRDFQYAPPVPATGNFEAWYGNTIDGNMYPDGFTWHGFVFWNLHTAITTDYLDMHYGSVDYWGKIPSNQTKVFYGTFTPPNNDGNLGGAVYLLEMWGANFVGPGTTVGNTSLMYWNMSTSGWHDTRMTAIGADDYTHDEGMFGLISLIMSNSTGPVTNVPMILYPVNDTGYASMSWYPGFQNCATTTADVDKKTHKTYAVYDWLNTTQTKYNLIIRQNNLTDMEGTDYDLAGWYMNTPSLDLRYPAVAAYNGNMVIATQIYNNSNPADSDIICWTYNKSSPTPMNLSDLNISVIAGSSSNETDPQVSWVSGNTFVCTFVNSTATQSILYYSKSTDGGQTWSIPKNITRLTTPAKDYVTPEYRTCDIGEVGNGTQKVFWEYRNTTLSEGRIHFKKMVFAQQSIRGDCNGDKIINVGDIVFLINYLFKGGSPPVPICTGDVNNDGIVNVGDIVYLINYLFKGGSPPIPPLC